MTEDKREEARKQLEEMNVIDDFLFTEIMADEKNGLEVCRMILSCVLKREVRNVHYIAQKALPGISESSHGIRMDAYITEKKGSTDDGHDDISVYDVEPDKKSAHRKGLPKRSRYYGDLIDVQLLNKGVDYDGLPEVVTIFILSFDPFGERAMYYEAGTVIKTHPHIPYDDGVRRIFLYTEGGLPEDAGDEEKKLRTLLRYINRSTEDNVTDDNTRKLDIIVKKTKLKKDVNSRFMKSWEIEREMKQEAQEAGRAEGRAEGLAEGRAEERANTEKERRRADEAEARVKELEARIRVLEETAK